MTRRHFAAAALAAALCGLTGPSWGRAWWAESHWQFTSTTAVSDAADLLSQYAASRQKTGHWPEPGSPYCAFFVLQNSERVAAKRLDTYRIPGPDGPWLQVALGDDGAISARMTWGERAPVAR